jgi:hypothetical protein
MAGLEIDGHERLCFSLKQIQYLQFYIHEMRLANPAWTDYLAKQSSLNEADQPKEGEELVPPEYVEEENDWVPIPGGIIRAEDLADVVCSFSQFLVPDRKLIGLGDDPNRR